MGTPRALGVIRPGLCKVLGSLLVCPRALATWRSISISQDRKSEDTLAGLGWPPLAAKKVPKSVKN